VNLGRSEESQQGNRSEDWRRFNKERGDQQQDWNRGDVVRQLWNELPQQAYQESDTSSDQTTDQGDMKTKLERSRQSARECRARKKLRYQYLDEIILEREKANDALRDKLEKYASWCQQLDKGIIPEGLEDAVNEEEEEASD